MPRNWDDDDQLLAALGEAVRAGQEVPDRFVEVGRAAFAWRDIDTELAALSHDSAVSATAGTGATRAGADEVRTLTFRAPRLTIELEFAADALLGQLVPAQVGEIEVQGRDGVLGTARADDVGFFAIRPRPSGLFRLRIRAGAGEPVVTSWVRP